MDLSELGWDTTFHQHFEDRKLPCSIPGRVSSEHRGAYEVMTESGAFMAEISGKFRNQAGADSRFPAVGDWVVVVPLPGEAKGIIHAILPERSRFSRQSAGGRERLSGGRTQEQTLAVNVDTVFIVGALDQGG